MYVLKLQYYKYYNFIVGGGANEGRGIG